MNSLIDQRQIDDEVALLMKAEASGDAEGLQKAYEDLFVLCQESAVDLPELLHEAESRRHAAVL